MTPQAAYVMIFNVAGNFYSSHHQSTWADLLRTRIQRLSGRRAPSWGGRPDREQGTTPRLVGDAHLEDEVRAAF